MRPEVLSHKTSRQGPDETFYVVDIRKRDGQKGSGEMGEVL